MRRRSYSLLPVLLATTLVVVGCDNDRLEAIGKQAKSELRKAADRAGLDVEDLESAAEALKGQGVGAETIPDLDRAARAWRASGAGGMASSGEQGRRLGAVRNWLYVLQGNDPGRIAAAGKDLVVTDFGRSGSSAFRPNEVEAMRRQGKTIVLAYISIGEAEDWRFYDLPACAGPENPDWPGCRWVRYWDPEWETILMGRGGYLDKILDAGFDGIYLDKVDAYQEVPRSIGVGRNEARGRMIALVGKIAAHCRRRRAGFLVVPQNAVELFDDPGYASLCDGIGQEETWFAATDDARDDYRNTEKRLTKVRRMGKTVLTVDYCRGGNARTAEERARRLGFAPFTTGDVDLRGLP